MRDFVAFKIHNKDDPEAILSNVCLLRIMVFVLRIYVTFILNNIKGKVSMLLMSSAFFA